MICFELFILESKVGSLSTPITTLIGPLFWIAKIAVHTNIFYSLLWPLHTPLSQGVMQLCQFQRQLLRLLLSISVVPLFREHRRYFYVRDRTGASQWEFPTEEDEEEEPQDNPGTQTQAPSQGDTKTSSGSTGETTGQSVTVKKVVSGKFLVNIAILLYSITYLYIREGKKSSILLFLFFPL